MNRDERKDLIVFISNYIVASSEICFYLVDCDRTIIKWYFLNVVFFGKTKLNF